MASTKSLDEVTLVANLLCSVQRLHCKYFSHKALRLTTAKLRARVASEGLSFLTKTLPRLARMLDSTLANQTPFDASKLRFTTRPGGKLPIFMGELFARVLDSNGSILPDACSSCVCTIRQVCYLLYKYELPYHSEQELAVIDQFIKTEQEIAPYDNLFSEIADLVDCNPNGWSRLSPSSSARILRLARRRLHRLFSDFDRQDINPRHGPGAVSTGERLSGKYQWTNISPRITATYAIDQYFCASLTHACDRLQELSALDTKESAAKVILVPKDSRGPRLISCEPLDFQWIQQGLGRAIVGHVENHRLTRDNVFFTNQEPNRNAALLGSRDGKYSTLDLKEASDRVTLGLVRLLFPEPLLEALQNCRSLSTKLPTGQNLVLRKFAPMGSALCFPVLALTVWSVLSAAAAYLDSSGLTASRVYVYGDDVIVPTAFAENAMTVLGMVGLAVNHDKSCVNGFFKESCGMDAFKGVNVTPVRVRTVQRSAPSPEVYTSWIAYANSMYDRQYFEVYDYIVDWLGHSYGQLPQDGQVSYDNCPSLRSVPEAFSCTRRRSNRDLQRSELLVRCVESKSVTERIDGWSMLLRYFAESGSKGRPAGDFVKNNLAEAVDVRGRIDKMFPPPFSVSQYTKRDASKLAFRWR